MLLPHPFLEDVERPRIEAAIHALRGAGEALLAVRGARLVASEQGDQLKTSVDQAAEGWVLGFLRGTFAKDVFLSEEEFEAAGAAWTPCEAFWTVDALDGTRSFVENYDGFCVQVAWIERGVPRFGLIHEPVTRRTFIASRGKGAFVSDAAGGWAKLSAREAEAGVAPCFVDSILPRGAVGATMQRRGAAFLECGSFGLKLCRVAEGRAQVFAKEVPFKVWDLAPGEVIVSEAGGAVGLLSGAPIPYATAEIRFHGVCAAATERLFRDIVAETAELV